MLDTDVPYFLASPYSVSPFATVCVRLAFATGFFAVVVVFFFAELLEAVVLGLDDDVDEELVGAGFDGALNE